MKKFKDPDTKKARKQLEKFQQQINPKPSKKKREKLIQERIEARKSVNLD